MAWPGCATTSEFIELMNFGPGPMNIGCYIVTNGQYAVTIPPNTILQAGQYYILSGQNTLAKDCGNQDSTVTVDLNWTTCNCTDRAIPTTSDGFMKDGGNANEKIVLLDPSLNVVDAVVRDITKPSPSVSITSKGLSGGCTSKTFDLASMDIRYEDIGQSTGVNNSYARRVDGDCGWVKTTAISAHAPNKTSSSSSATYEFSTLTASECNGTTGSIAISVNASNLAPLFPMNYTLAFDKDSNSVFNLNDEYLYGVDNEPYSININNLAYGRYRITVGSSLGCNLKSYDFFIFNCYGIVLPLKLISFRYLGIKEDQQVFECELNEAENLKTMVLEGSNGGFYQPVSAMTGPVSSTGGRLIINAPLSPYQNFRLRLTDKNSVVSYSSVLKITSQLREKNRQWPNPVKEKVSIQLNAVLEEKATCLIYNSAGAVVSQENLDLKKGVNFTSISAGHLQPGICLLTITGRSQTHEPISFRFVKH
jgi:hypothetical protein